MHVCHLVNQEVFEILVCSLVLSHLDYANSNLSKSPLLLWLLNTVPYMHTQAIVLTTLDNYICSK